MMTHQRGYLMIVAVIIIVIIGILSAALLRMTTSMSLGSLYTLSANQAYTLANTGVEDNAYLLATSVTSPTTCGGVTQGPFTLSTGQYQYTCNPISPTTTLSSAITSGATSLTATSASGFSAAGALVVDGEVMYYNQISGNQFQGLRRGQESTTAAAHSISAPITQFQYSITATGGVPSLTTNPQAQRVINQAVNYVVFAAGATGKLYSYLGGWGNPLTLASANQINDIVCLTAKDCKAVGNGGKFYAYNGATWVLTATLGALAVNGIDCISTNNCAAVGARVSTSASQFYTYNGSWTAPARVNLGGTDSNISAISCFTSGTYSGQCRAAGVAGSTSNSRFYFSTTSPFTWTVDQYNFTVGGATDFNINAIYCFKNGSGSTPCLAAGDNGYFYTGGGSGTGTWSRIIGPTTTAIYALTCADSTHCMAAGASGRFYAYNGTTWSSSTTVGSNNIRAISCVSANDCKAAGDGGLFYSYDGTSWVLSQTLNPVENIFAISAPAAAAIHSITSNLSPL